MGMCAHSSAAPSQHAHCHTEKTETRGFFFFHSVSLREKKKKTDVRTQNSLNSPNLKTATTSSFHPSPAENLMSSQSRVCPDHHFLPQPLTYLSSLIEFTRTQSASCSCSRSVRRCQSLPKKKKHCRDSLTCLPANFLHHCISTS